MKLSAVLIVKNEAGHLPQCLEALRVAFDEIVVVDTGSTDGTAQLALGFTEHVHQFPWTGDFSAARNYALSHATSNWVLSVDADETLRDPERARGLLLEFARRHDEQTVGFVQVISQLAPRRGEEAEVIDRLERFFSRAHFHWAGAVHEQLKPNTGDKQLGDTGLVFHHSGYVHAPDDPGHKARRNIPLLERALREAPDDEYFAYQLGKAWFALEDWRRAHQYLDRALRRIHFEADTPPVGLRGFVSPSVVLDCLISCAYALVNDGHVGAARHALEYHLKAAPAIATGPDFYHAFGYVCLMQGDLGAAREHFNSALHFGPSLENVRGCGSWSAAYHLGLVAEALGDVPGAMAHYLLALEQKPTHRPTISRCVECMAEYRALLPGGVLEAMDRDRLSEALSERAGWYRERGESEKAAFLGEARAALGV